MEHGLPHGQLGYVALHVVLLRRLGLLLLDVGLRWHELLAVHVQLLRQLEHGLPHGHVEHVEQDELLAVHV